jgi:ABC-type antimicrobial peptide transport system permease subunit
VGLLMLAAGLLAALIPARRILQIDPAMSLRAE